MVLTNRTMGHESSCKDLIENTEILGEVHNLSMYEWQQLLWQNKASEGGQRRGSFPGGSSGAVVWAVVPARPSLLLTAPGVYLSGYAPGGATCCAVGRVGGAGPWRRGQTG